MVSVFFLFSPLLLLNGTKSAKSHFQWLEEENNNGVSVSLVEVVLFAMALESI